ncbi:sensor histidine kinase [Paenibacillus sp. FSL W8-1187]|uniref:cache domain-containing sensor histidine kinase n=1 Tax=Paenibacillus sp. FSL W8-1187 TaxID=2975339 RepID=UPI0030DB1A5C
MRTRLRNANTLRNQILAVCVLVMALVLLFVGFYTYRRVSTVITSNAERQLQQTAIEAIGRLETLYRQVDMLSSQVMTASEVQQLLLQESRGRRSTLGQRQSLLQSVRTLQVYSDGIASFDLFTRDYRSLSPLDESRLTDRLQPEQIALADRGSGRLAWIGEDPKDPAYFLAVRSVRLMDHSFESAGYLLVRIERSTFDLGADEAQERREFMTLLDGEGRVITSDYGGSAEALPDSADHNLDIGGEPYLQVRQTSQLTGWKLVILAPVKSLTEGIGALRTAIVAAGAVGFLICLVCSFFLSAMITRPILRLIKTMRGARLGELRPSPEVHSTVEINELTKTYNQLVGHMNDLIQVIYEKELIRSRTELKALQAQIDPHFLYNTLEALFWALQDKEEEELANLVVAMSDLFRYTIGSEHGSEWVTLREELDHAERYMQLMKLRFGDRLEWSLSAPPDSLELRMPKLLLQPLVENAILHGVGAKKGPGSVSLRVEPAGEPDLWSVAVEDDGPGMDAELVQALSDSLGAGGPADGAGKGKGKGSGMALANVSKRLQLYYKDRPAGGLRIESRPGEGTTVGFDIPGGTA